MRQGVSGCGTPRLLGNAIPLSSSRLEHDPSVWYGFGYHGNSVNTAPWVDMVLARNMTGSNREHMPAPLAGLSPRFRLPKLRLWALRAAYLYYQYQDWRQPGPSSRLVVIHKQPSWLFMESEPSRLISSPARFPGSSRNQQLTLVDFVGTSSRAKLVPVLYGQTVGNIRLFLP